MRILLIEDDAEVAQNVAKSLKQHGHIVEHAADGRDGLMLAIGERFDVVIVDRMLPALDGLSLIKSVRTAKIGTPMLILTTKGGIEDRVEGLEAGADDYLVKPFALAELIARVHALARRPAMTQEATVLTVADLTLDLVKRTVSRAGQSVDVQPQEFKLLEYMMRHAGKAVTRTMLLENVWDFHFDPRTNIVETHMSRLRSKVDRGFDLELIETIRGVGYRLRAPD
ncbi:MAG: response regulator transcription factor [Hyphomicrobiaceae bacterium]